MSLDIELILHALSKGFEALEARWETRIPSSGVIHHGQEAASELPSPSPTTTTSAAAADNVAAPATTPDGADAGQKVLLAAPTINTKLVAAATSASASSTPTPGPAARAAVVENTSSTTPTRCSTQAPTPTPAPGNNAASLVSSSTPPTNSPTKCSTDCLSHNIILLKISSAAPTSTLSAATLSEEVEVANNSPTRYISIDSLASSSGAVLLRYASEVHEAPEVLVGMTRRCLVMPWLVYVTVVDIGPWPPPLEKKNTLLATISHLYFSVGLSFCYGQHAVKQRPPWPPPLLCCQNSPTDTAQPCLRSWQSFICGLTDGQLMQPWPPSVQSEMQIDGVHVRLKPWSFYRSLTMVVQWEELMSRQFGYSVSQFRVKLLFEDINEDCLQYWQHNLRYLMSREIDGIRWRNSMLSLEHIFGVSSEWRWCTDGSTPEKLASLDVVMGVNSSSTKHTLILAVHYMILTQHDLSHFEECNGPLPHFEECISRCSADGSKEMPDPGISIALHCNTNSKSSTEGQQWLLSIGQIKIESSLLILLSYSVLLQLHTDGSWDYIHGGLFQLSSVNYHWTKVQVIDRLYPLQIIDYLFRLQGFLISAFFFVEIKNNVTGIKYLQVPWDPGGIDLIHRLGGKPILKKGGMLGSQHTYGLTYWASTRSGPACSRWAQPMYYPLHIHGEEELSIINYHV